VRVMYLETVLYFKFFKVKKCFTFLQKVSSKFSGFICNKPGPGGARRRINPSEVPTILPFPIFSVSFSLGVSKKKYNNVCVVLQQ
jgi:hypothetical protein